MGLGLAIYGDVGAVDVFTIPYDEQLTADQLRYERRQTCLENGCYSFDCCEGNYWVQPTWLEMIITDSSGSRTSMKFGDQISMDSYDGILSPATCSAFPTEVPTPGPSLSPIPSGVPTISNPPSSGPTSAPSYVPTPMPSLLPSISVAPTYEPTITKTPTTTPPTPLPSSPYPTLTPYPSVSPTTSSPSRECTNGGGVPMKLFATCYSFGDIDTCCTLSNARGCPESFKPSGFNWPYCAKACGF